MIDGADTGRQKQPLRGVDSDRGVEDDRARNDIGVTN